MKIHHIIGGLLIGMMATSCQKEYKEIGEVPSKIEGISASWTLRSCTVIDKAAIVEESLEITPFLLSGTKAPNIRMYIEGGQGFYTCDNDGVAFQFFGGASGQWAFDNAEFPKKVIFTPTGSTPFEMPLAAPIRPTDSYLQLDQSIKCGGKEKFVYRLSFTRN